MPTRTPAPTVIVASPAQLVELVREAVLDVMPGRTEPTPALLDRRGLAVALDVSTDTVDKLRAEGCPSVRVGDAPRFRLEAVIAWLEAREGRK